jgi:uncharacterized protein
MIPFRRQWFANCSTLNALSPSGIFPKTMPPCTGWPGRERWRAALIAVVVFFVSASILLAERVEDLPKPTDYVSDFAHVLSPEAIARVDRICGQLDHSQANSQVAIVTVRTLDGEDAADFASALEDKWHIGKKGSDRGVLILLAVNDHKRRIDVGYGLEGILPDGKVGDIGREMVPYLRANDFDGAIIIAVTQIGEVIAADAKVTLQDGGLQQDQLPQPHSGRRPARHGFPLGGLIFLIIIVVFFGGFRLLAFLFGWSLLTGGSRGGPFIGGGGWGGGGFGGGGGGGGGGDSGFGGFGGGDFGGGGAGGDW